MFDDAGCVHAFDLRYVMQLDGAPFRIDNDNDRRSGAQVDGNLIVNIVTPVVRGKDFDGDIRRERRYLQILTAEPAEALVGDVRNVRYQRPPHVTRRCDAKSPFRSDLSTPGGPPIQRHPKRELEPRVIALGAHFLKRASAHPLGFRLRLRKKYFLLSHGCI